MWLENPGPPPQLRLPGPGGGVSPVRRVRKSHRATLGPRMAQLAGAGLGAGFVYFCRKTKLLQLAHDAGLRASVIQREA